MNSELQNQLYQLAPTLYEMAKNCPEWKIDVTDDLFPFLKELSLEIERFNQRYRKRSVRVMKVAMTDGNLVFWVHRQIPVIEKKLFLHGRKSGHIVKKNGRLCCTGQNTWEQLLFLNQP